MHRIDIAQYEPISHKGTIKCLGLSTKKNHLIVTGDDSGTVRLLECALLGKHNILNQIKQGGSKVRFAVNVGSPVTNIGLVANRGKRENILVATDGQMTLLDPTGQSQKFPSQWDSSLGDGAIRSLSFCSPFSYNGGGQGQGGSGAGPNQGTCLNTIDGFPISSLGKNSSGLPGDSKFLSFLMDQNLYFSHEECSRSSVQSLPATINDSIIVSSLFSSQDPKEIFNIVACQDKTLRVFSFLANEKTVQSTERFSVLLPEAPTSLQLFCPHAKNYSFGFSNDFQTMKPEEILKNAFVLYGTVSGSLGLVRFSETSSEVVWSWNDNAQGSQLSQLSQAVTSLSLADIDCDGFLELAVGRVDGRLEILKFPQGGFHPPEVAYSFDLSHRIQSLQASYGSILVALSTGRILAYVPTNSQELGLQAGPDGRYTLAAESKSLSADIMNFFSSSNEDFQGKNLWDLANESYLQSLKSEIKELKATVQKEKEKSKKILESNSTSTSAAAAASAQLLTPEIHVETSLSLDESISAYVLRIELTQTDLDLALVRCPCPLEIIDTENNSTYSSGWVHSKNSLSESQEKSGAKESDETLLIYHNSKENKNNRQILLAFRPREGYYGDILLTLVSAKPPKAAKIFKFYLSPLSLHIKINEKDRQIETLSVKDKSVLEYTEGLQEVSRQYISEAEGQDARDYSWLDEEYQTILRDQDSIRAAWARRDNTYATIKDLLLNLYMDWQRLQGHDELDFEPEPVLRCIEENDFDRLLDLFKKKTEGY